MSLLVKNVLIFMFLIHKLIVQYLKNVKTSCFFINLNILFTLQYSYILHTHIY